MSYQIIRQITRRGEVQTETIEVLGERLRIGRGPSNDVCLESLSVSQFHAEIQKDPQGRYVLKGIAKRGNIFVNGNSLDESTALRDGDRIGIDHYELVVSQPEPLNSLVLTVEERVHDQSEPSSKLFSALQLSQGRFTRKSLSIWLSILVLVGSLGALGVGKEELFSPGPVSIKHQKFSGQCEKCHANWKAVWNLVPDKTCQGCHPREQLTPSHFGDRAQFPVPQCASCHLEHKNELSLVEVHDNQCEQCHGDLKVKDPRIPVVKNIHGFSSDHPEFAITRKTQDGHSPTRVRFSETSQLKDDARLKLNHKCHLSPGLILEPLVGRPKDRPSDSLVCKDCHTTDQEGQYMQPINYERHCKQCHLLEFDPKLPNQTVPHGLSFSELRQKLNEIYADVYFKSLPEKKQRAQGMRRLPGRPATVEEKLFVNERVERAAKLLFPPQGKVCLKCHAVEFEESGKKQLVSLPVSRDDCGTEGKAKEQRERPKKKKIDTFFKVPYSASVEIANVNVPHRWLPYSRFDHAAHFGLPLTQFQLPEITSSSEKVCFGCHADVHKSRETKDVLLAGVSRCRECHKETGGAQAQCKTCHEFHPKRHVQQMTKREVPGQDNM